MSRRWLLAAAATSALAASPVRAADPAIDLQSLIEAEQSFASASLGRGMREAFLSYLAEDAILFRPRPVGGRQWWLDRPDITGILKWAPTFADLSRNGDMGFTTGPYEFRSDGTDTAQVSYGHFVSIWRRQRDGKWRVVTDLGIPHEKPDSSAWLPHFPARPTTADARGQRLADTQTARRALQQADRAVCAACARSAMAGYVVRSAPDLRFYRPGALPRVGLEEALEQLERVSFTCKAAAAVVAGSGDLGYTYGGMATTTPKGATMAKGKGAKSAVQDSASYLRIWRPNPKGEWKMVLDIMVPIPRAEP